MNTPFSALDQSISSGLTTLLVCAALLAPSESRTQTNSVLHSDPLDIFAGTWIATNPNETAPYFILRFEKRDGKLIGTMNRFRFAVAEAGRLVGRQQTPGEVPLSDLKIDGGLLSFTWRVNPPFEGAPATFVVEGTKVGMLVLSVSGDAIRKIMVDNPRASGMNPVVSLNRVSESELHELIRGAAVSPQPKASEQWKSPPWRGSSILRRCNTSWRTVCMRTIRRYFGRGN